MLRRLPLDPAHHSVMLAVLKGISRTLQSQSLKDTPPSAWAPPHHHRDQQEPSIFRFRIKECASRDVYDVPRTERRAFMVDWGRVVGKERFMRFMAKVRLVR